MKNDTVEIQIAGENQDFLLRSAIGFYQYW